MKVWELIAALSQQEAGAEVTAMVDDVEGGIESLSTSFNGQSVCLFEGA